MSNPQLLPGADTKIQWFEDDYPGARVEVLRGVLHTTEGRDWPSYSGGKVAPNLTAKPNQKTRKLAWRQHFSIDRSARALRNETGGVQTNTDGVVQIELVGTCDPATRDAWVKAGKRQDVDFTFWPEAPDWLLDELARVIYWIEVEHAVPAIGPEQHGKRWTAYPASYGTAAGNRLSGPQWDDFRGWCGHQHVPENVHGDPGALAFGRVLAQVAVLRAADQPQPTLTTTSSTLEYDVMLLVKDPAENSAAQWIVRPDLTGRTHVVDDQSLKQLEISGAYKRVALSARQFAKIPVIKP